MLTTLHFDDRDFRMPAMGHDFCRDLAPFNIGRAYFDIGPITHHHDLIKIDCFTRFSLHFFESKDFTWLYPVLFATTFYYSVHIFNPND